MTVGFKRNVIGLMNFRNDYAERVIAILPRPIIIDFFRTANR